MRNAIYLSQGFDSITKLKPEIKKMINGKIPESISVSIIVTEKAIFPNENYYRGVMNSTRVIQQLGFKIDRRIIISNLDCRSRIDDIMNSDIIYLAGGDPYKQKELIEYIKLQEYLKEYQEGVLIAKCGGTMTISDNIIEFPTVSTDYMGNVKRVGKGLKSLRVEKGVNLNDFSVVPVSEVYSKINQMVEPGYGTMDFNDAPYLSEFMTPIIPLKSSEALYSENDDVYLLGSSYCRQVTPEGIIPVVLEETPKGKRMVLQ